MQISISHYLKNMAILTEQFTDSNYKDPNRQRLYLKDIDCPKEWHHHLKEVIPPGIFYMNETVAEVGDPGSVEEPNPWGTGTSLGKGLAKAGDLMSSLSPEMRADNLQCYIGHEGTYTPAHREMCASLGQNLMVDASGIEDENGVPTKPGSSIWFMTESKQRHVVSEYWSFTLGHDIEVESYFAQINAWRAAPFKTYVTEQKTGDFILVPPLATHQVWNRGTRTMKVAWNRTTVETLELALNEALPRARIVCRDEQYKNKAIVLFTLEKYSKILDIIDERSHTAVDLRDRLDSAYAPKIRQLRKDFKRLFSLYNQILLSEILPPMPPSEKRPTYLPYESFVTCSYCRCNIFNRFLTCTTCIIALEDGEEDTYDICMDCFVMGRSCKCVSKYQWVEQFQWQELTEKHERWRLQVMRLDGAMTSESPQTLLVQRKNLAKKTLAHVCYEQLKIRPWCDPNKQHEPPPLEEESDPKEDQANSTGNALKRRKRPSLQMHRGFQRCHISQRLVPKWKLALCQCGRVYHYGTLFRAFDLMPLTVMEDQDWQCPHCRKICSCGACRKRPEMKPFEPKRTMLGLDTKEFADPRSIDGLLDFSHSNIGWIKKSGDDDPHESRRLRRLKDEAGQDKSVSAAPALDGFLDNPEQFVPMHGQHSDFVSLHGHYPDSRIHASESDIDLSIDPMLKTVNISPSTPNQFGNGWHAVNTHPEPALQPGEFSTGYEFLSPELRPPQAMAPLAYMANQSYRSPYAPDANTGNPYTYPDPSLIVPQMTPSPPGHFKKFSSSVESKDIQVDIPPQENIISHEQDPQENVKRKRSDTRSIVQSDLQPTNKKRKDTTSSRRFSTSAGNMMEDSFSVEKSEDVPPRKEAKRERKPRLQRGEESPPRKKPTATRVSLRRDSRKATVNYAEIPPEPYSPIFKEETPNDEESKVISPGLSLRKKGGQPVKNSHSKSSKQSSHQQTKAQSDAVELFAVDATLEHSRLGPADEAFGLDAANKEADEIREAELLELMRSNEHNNASIYSSSVLDNPSAQVRPREGPEQFIPNAGAKRRGRRPTTPKA